MNSDLSTNAGDPWDRNSQPAFERRSRIIHVAEMVSSRRRRSRRLLQSVLLAVLLVTVATGCLWRSAPL